MTFELNETGLQTETQTEIRAKLVSRLKATFGVNLRTSTQSIMGQIVNILSEMMAYDQQTLLAVYRSFDPNGAMGAALDARLALTGNVRLGATHSTVEGFVELSGAETVPNGMRILNEDNGTLWELISGDIVGTTGSYAATFQAVDTGPIEAAAGTTWSNVTVLANVVGFTNPTDDAEIGRDREPDGDARKRRLIELFSQGQGPLGAIRSVVSQVDGVVSVQVYHNPTTSPADSNSIPFKAFNVVVETSPAVPTSDMQTAIANAIWSAMGAGGYAYGTDYSVLILDGEGQLQTVSFDVVSVSNIKLAINLVTSTSENLITPNIEDVVAERILAVAQANHEQVGRDVRALDYKGIVYDMLAAGEISGVDDVSVQMSIAPAAVAAVAKISIGVRSKADFDSANITVTQS